jgi:type III secretion protein V
MKHRLANAPRADLMLALLVVAVIAMMVVPLPTVLIDLLIALNLGFGVLLLAAALYMRDALSFAAFPTLLLLSTLYRLALNVASTRLILLQADAGRVIEAFGSFVVRGDYRVGALVFAMLTLIQFIVIARGAERVAEVGARFSLDALPGKQLAIDAELRAGSLRPEQARALRQRLTRESQLYGALDGALKFVKGDAIAGIVITLINFVGGVSLGVFARDLELGASLSTYGLLTIGDGLVTQIPALLGATAAGLVVTRVAPTDGEGASLARDIGDTLLGEPRALAVGALVLSGLAIVPGLPSWPFLAIAAACAFGAYTARRRERADGGLDTLSAHGLHLELGMALHTRFVARGVLVAELTSAISDVQRELFDSLGVALPSVTPLRSTALAANELRWLWRELPGPRCAPATDDVAQTAARALRELGRRRADEALDLDEVLRRLDALAHEQPALVNASIPNPLTPTLLAEVLRQLVREGVSVRWLSEIVQAIAPHALRESSAHALVERARRALARRISHALAPSGELNVLRLSPELEETLDDALRRGEQHSEVLALPHALAEEITRAVAAAHRSTPAPCALVTQAALRRHVHALLRECAPDLPVVCAYELMPHLSLSTAEPIGP